MSNHNERDWVRRRGYQRKKEEIELKGLGVSLQEKRNGGVNRTTSAGKQVHVASYTETGKLGA